MHIPRHVFSWLYESDLEHDEKSFFAAVVFLRPANLADLATKTGLGRHKVVRVCRTLAERGWLKLVQKSRQLRPVCWIPREYQERLVEQLRDAYKMAPFKSEFLFRQLLDYWVDADYYLDNARPSFLTNPLTGEPLEIDRFIPGVAGFECNGDQHYTTTEIFSDARELNERQCRDLMKEALSRRKGIALVTVSNVDLSIKGMRSLLPSNARLHEVDADGPYAVALDRLCATYATYGRKAAPPQKSKNKNSVAPTPAGAQPEEAGRTE